jgi:hypothetical protein
MTQHDFYQLCSDHWIDPDIALENDDLRQALKDKDDAKVAEILTNEF